MGLSKRFLVLFATCAGVGVLALWLVTSPWVSEHVAGPSSWAEKHKGVVELAAFLSTFFFGLLAVIRWLFLGPASDAQEPTRAKTTDKNQVEIERRYLEELLVVFEEMQHDSSRLTPETEEEIVEMRAQLNVEPRYRIDPFSGDTDLCSYDGDQAKDKPTFSKDLVGLLLKTRDPVVVIGDPGSGKTVSLQKTMVALVHKGLAEPQPAFLPIYLPLRNFRQSLDSPDPVIDFAKQSLHALGGPAPKIADHLDEYLAQGRVVLLLDAMDEMPRDGGVARRFDALSKLRHYAGNKILFACRKLDFPESFPFTRATILPFNRRQIRRFLRLAPGNLGRSAARDLLSADNPLRDLASNPFFLKLLAVYYAKERHRPDSRAELLLAYEGQVFQRAKNRAGFPSTLTQSDFHAVLARLGYMIMISGGGVTMAWDKLTSGFIPTEQSDGEAMLAQVLPSVEIALQVAIAEAVGILVLGLFSSALFWSRRVLGAPAMHINERVQYWRDGGIVKSVFFAYGLILLAGLGIKELVLWLRLHDKVRPAIEIATAVVLLAFISAFFIYWRRSRQTFAESLSTILRQLWRRSFWKTLGLILGAVVLSLTIMAAVFGLLYGIGYGVWWVLNRLGIWAVLGRALTWVWHFLGPVLALIIIFAATAVVLYLVWGVVQDVRDYLAVLYARLFPKRLSPMAMPKVFKGKGRSKLRDREMLIQAGVGMEMSAEQRASQYRESLREVQSPWARAMIYEDLNRLRPEIRHRRGDKDRDETNGEEGEP
jgi:hypothetical protein